MIVILIKSLINGYPKNKIYCPKEQMMNLVSSQNKS
jgi:hypothetical protein